MIIFAADFTGKSAVSLQILLENLQYHFRFYRKTNNNENHTEGSYV